MASTGADMSLPNVIHFLQTENARFERDRNYWELEKAEMKTYIARLEGERKGNERTKDWYLRRLKMLEMALQQERAKNGVEAPTLPTSILEEAKREVGAQLSKPSSRARLEHTDSYVQVVRGSQEDLRQASGRNKSRIFLEKCLSEITYLTADIDVKPEPNGQVSLPALEAVQQSDADFNSIQSPLRIPSPPAVEPHMIQTSKAHAVLASEIASTSHDDGTADESSPDVCISHVYDSQGNLQSESRYDTDDWDFSQQTMIELPKTQLKLRGRMRGHLLPVSTIVASSHAHPWYITGSSDETIKIFNSADEEPVVALRAHQGKVRCLAIDTDQSNDVKMCFFSAGYDGQIRHWSINLDALSAHRDFDSDLLPDLQMQSPGNDVRHLAYGAGRLYSAYQDGSVQVWSPWAVEPKLFKIEHKLSIRVHVVAISCLGDPIEDQVAVQYSNGAIMLFRRSDGAPIRRSSKSADQEQIIDGLSYISSGHLLFARGDRQICSLDLGAGRDFVEEGQILSTHDAMTCFAVNPRGDTIMIASTSGMLQIWNIGTRQCVQELQYGQMGVLCCATWSMDDAGTDILILGSETGVLHTFST